MSDRLNAARHEAIRQVIRRSYLSYSEPRDRPVAIIIAGQPGAGKGRVAEKAEVDLARRGGSVVIDPDELRERHPNYRNFIREDDRTAADRVHADASQWAKELRRDAMDGRRNIIIDGTLNDKDKARELLGQLREAGYETEVRALAVHERDSRQGVYARYENAREKGATARWVPEDVQDEAYKGLPGTLGHVERNGLADKVSVLRRDGSIVYRNANAAAGTSGLSQIALLSERVRDPTEEEKIRHLRSWDKIHTQMLQRGANADDVAKVSGYRWEAYDRIRSDRPIQVMKHPGEAMPKPGAESIRALSAAQKALQEEWRRQER